MTGRIDLDFDAPRGLCFYDEEGCIGVVTTMFDSFGDLTQDPAEACQLVVYMGDGYHPDGSWLRVDVAPNPENRTALPAGEA